MNETHLFSIGFWWNFYFYECFKSNPQSFTLQTCLCPNPNPGFNYVRSHYKQAMVDSKWPETFSSTTPGGTFFKGQNTVNRIYSFWRWCFSTLLQPIVTKCVPIETGIRKKTQKQWWTNKWRKYFGDSFEKVFINNLQSSLNMHLRIKLFPNNWFIKHFIVHWNSEITIYDCLAYHKCSFY